MFVTKAEFTRMVWDIYTHEKYNTVTMGVRIAFQEYIMKEIHEKRKIVRKDRKWVKRLWEHLHEGKYNEEFIRSSALTDEILESDIQNDSLTTNMELDHHEYC